MRAGRTTPVAAGLPESRGGRCWRAAPPRAVPPLPGTLLRVGQARAATGGCGGAGWPAIPEQRYPGTLKQRASPSVRLLPLAVMARKEGARTNHGGQPEQRAWSESSAAVGEAISVLGGVQGGGARRPPRNTLLGPAPPPPPGGRRGPGCRPSWASRRPRGGTRPSSRPGRAGRGRRRSARAPG
jgi:hypothetical protein